MSPEIYNEKATTVAASGDGETNRLSAFCRKRQNKTINTKSGTDDDKIEVGAPVSKVIAPVSFTELFRFATRFELMLNFIGLVAACGAGSAQPLMTLIFGNLVQSFVSFGTTLAEAKAGDSKAQLKLPVAAAAFRDAAAGDAAILTYIGLALFACTFTYMYIWVHTGEVTTKRLREHYLRAILRQDIAFFDNVGAGEVATRIQTDTHLVQQGISEKMAMCGNYISAFFTGFILAYCRSWRLALAMSTILPCIATMSVVMSKFLSSYMQSSRRHVSDGGSMAEEVISTIRTAQAFGTQKILADIYDTHIKQSKATDAKIAMVNGAGLAIFFFILYSSYGLAFSFGTTLINEGHATAGEVIIVFMSILVGSVSLAQLAPEMQAVTQARGASAKLYETIDRIPDIDSSDPSGLKPEKVEGHITFESVRFNYPSRPNVAVVKNLSISFPAGKTAALVGASGSGKSTVVALVERFYDPLFGLVKLDGVDLKELNIKWLRTQIGLVSQEPILFATTIKENVAHGLIGTDYEHASEEEKFALIKNACVKANADGFINKMPMGYDTMVGERGFLMSGGQKQRIAIARAIVADPKILLLDEATSALDTQSEGIVQDALDKAAAGRTTITIAHRLSTIKDAHCIFIMGDGLVLEQGTHDELLRDENGPYSRLVAAQKLRANVELIDTDSATSGSDEDMEKKALGDVPLGRKNSDHSLSSEIAGRNNKTLNGTVNEDGRGLPYLFLRMGKLNRAAWTRYAIGVVAACMSGMVPPAFGVLYAKGINGFSDLDPHQRRHDGDRTALWFFVIALISTCTIGLQSYMFGSAAATLTAKVRSLSLKAILRQDIEFFDKDENSSGGLTGSLSDNAQKINGLAGVTLGTIVQSCSTVISGLILGFAFIWKIGFVALACMPVVLSTGYIRLRVVVLKDEINRRAHEESAQIACEAAGAIRTVASLTREEDCCKIYSKSLQEPLRRSNRSALWSNMLFAISQSVTMFVIGLVFFYGSRLVSTLEFSNFQFFVGLMSSVFSAINAGSVFSYVPDISSAKSAGFNVLQLIDSRPEIDAESTEGKEVSSMTVRGQICLENIHFRYPTRLGVRVLHDMSLKVESGTYIAVVGASGSGKSTVLQLIERFYDPLAGQIYLDGVPISELNIQEYRKQIALVSQEPTLYAGTVRFNILLGAAKPVCDVTQDEIEQACRNANILDFINSLPDGFDTEIGSKGSQLSGGQKQRIAIARALLRNPKVLLLDEATSALDSTSEKVVQVALDQAAKGRTTIAIAHRLSTIQNADCIYFIKDGKVCEFGTHEALLRKKGDYYEYVQLQGLGRRE